MRHYDEAIADYDAALRLDPRSAEAHSHRGLARAARGEYKMTLADYDEVIRLDPESASAHDKRAWFRATCPDAKFRDGPQGVRDATRACDLSRYDEADHRATLAAAYAETGDFARAVEYQEKANKLRTIALLRTEGEARLKLYQTGKPYRDEE